MLLSFLTFRVRSHDLFLYDSLSQNWRTSMVLVIVSVHRNVLKSSMENMAQVDIGNCLHTVYAEINDISPQVPLLLLMSMGVLIQPQQHIDWGLWNLSTSFLMGNCTVCLLNKYGSIIGTAWAGNRNSLEISSHQKGIVYFWLQLFCIFSRVTVHFQSSLNKTAEILMEFWLFLNTSFYFRLMDSFIVYTGQFEGISGMCVFGSCVMKKKVSIAWLNWTAVMKLMNQL